MSSDDTTSYPVELLNSFDLSRVPSHKLELKVYVPVLLMRNLDAPRLCNAPHQVVLKNIDFRTVQSIANLPTSLYHRHFAKIPFNRRYNLRNGVAFEYYNFNRITTESNDKRKLSNKSSHQGQRLTIEETVGRPLEAIDRVLNVDVSGGATYCARTDETSGNRPWMVLGGGCELQLLFPGAFQACSIAMRSGGLTSQFIRQISSLSRNSSTR
ncbi:hypothetical protein TNCV_2866741 [Trichonephila clavipes]|nr:hypothetical protein TNCV_2866741 [Trichonephila clavipes]